MKISFLILLIVFCSFANVNAMHKIDANMAKELALARYHELFKDKYYLNPVDSKYYKFPELDTTYFNFVDITQCCWVLEAAPPAGVYIDAKVDVLGKWVEITRVGFSSE